MEGRRLKRGVVLVAVLLLGRAASGQQVVGTRSQVPIVWGSGVHFVAVCR